MKKEKLLTKARTHPNNISFAELQNLLESYAFELVRSKGSHMIYKHPKLEGIVNIQQVNNKAKPYQVKQVLEKIDLL